MSGFALRGLGDYLAHPGLGDDGTTTDLSLVDPFNLSTTNLVTDPSQMMTGPSFPSAYTPGTTTGLTSSDINFPSASGLTSAQWASLSNQLTNILGKVLVQNTVPSGQIQITGPNGQSEVIQTNANTAGIGIPGLNLSNYSQWLLPAGILLAILFVGWGHK
jgi:hypothetical protein